jgi:hypothetical protein
MGAMAEEIIFEADPFVETCNRLYSKWKVTYTLNAKPERSTRQPIPYTLLPELFVETCNRVFFKCKVT